MTEINAGFGSEGGLGAGVAVYWCNAEYEDLDTMWPDEGAHLCTQGRGHPPPHRCGKEKKDSDEQCDFTWD